MPPALLVQAIDLEKRYVDGPAVVSVLEGLDLEIEAGERIAIVGESGVGKSTLLHLLGALDRPTAGRVLFQGEDLFARGEAGLVHYRRQNVGFVFQFYNLLGELSALENAMIPALLLRKPPAQARELAAAALAEVGLADRLRHYPGELSGGEQQRVAIARALTNGPRLVLADEPTGNLDQNNSRAIMQLVTGMSKADGVTFIIATHNLEIVQEMRSRLFLKAGRVATDFMSHS